MVFFDDMFCVFDLVFGEMVYFIDISGGVVLSLIVVDGMFYVVSKKG